MLVSLSPKDFSRVGHCWMRDRLLDGDLAMVLSHAGDAFWDYVLVEHGSWIRHGKENRHGYRLIGESRFGAYVLGTPFKYQPTEREYHLLVAGIGQDFGWVALEADTETPVPV